MTDEYANRFSSVQQRPAEDGSTQVKEKIREAQSNLKPKAAAEDFADNGMFSFIPMDPFAEEDDDTGADDDAPLTFQDTHDLTWYRSNRVLGKGTFGAVYLGMSDSGVLAALKYLTLRADASTEDLETEAEALLELEHENVVQFISAAVLKKCLVFALEYVPGGSLITVLEGYDGKIPANVVKKFARDILNGLHYLHDQNVVHCDIKPHNVLVAADGTCKLTDFGSAVLGKKAGKRVGREPVPTNEVQSSTTETTLRGTLKYMAPEVADGREPIAASDIWSFGITVAELSTGNLPWKLPKMSQLGFIQELGKGSIRPTLEGVDGGLRALIERCWIPDPGSRPTAADLLNDPYLVA